MFCWEVGVCCTADTSSNIVHAVLRLGHATGFAVKSDTSSEAFEARDKYHWGIYYLL